MNAEIFYAQSGPFWDWRLALDLFLGGAGVGALLFAVLMDEGFKGKYRRLCQTAVYLSPLLLLAGLAMVMMKIGRPDRLFHVYVNMNPSAPLWWGGFFQPILVLAAFAYALKWRTPPRRDASRKWLGRVIAPLAVTVGAYHGLLLSVLVARPLWTPGPTVVAALLGFASTGIAIVMLVHLLRMKAAGRLDDQEHVAAFLDDIRVVRNALAGLLVLQLGTSFLWWLSLRFGAIQHQQALAAANETYGAMFWWIGLGVGIVVPLGLGTIAVWRGEAAHRRLQITMIGLTSGFVLVGGFFFRLALLLGGQVQLPVTMPF